jgi:hypothetical protein
MINVLKKQVIAEPSNEEENPFPVFEELRKEELSLIKVKRDLLAFREKLQGTIEEEIEGTRLRIQTLKHEISDLKQTCKS